MIRATFTEAKKRNNERARLICNQTNAVYVVTPNLLGGFSIFCNGWKVAERSNMSWALLFIQQDADIAVRSSVHA